MPVHEVEIGPYEIDIYPVTHAQWARFVAETGARQPEVRGPGSHFVTGISWQEANAYAAHYQLDLPSEAEWEHAARNDRSFFTWGDAYFPQGTAAFEIDEPYAVGTRPGIAIVRGVHDLLGIFGEYSREPFGPYPGMDLARWERRFPNTRGHRAVRGGYDPNQDATCVSRRGVPEDERRKHVKFRCVRRS
jgi:iron(II)-dependent oxidoreductase